MKNNVLKFPIRKAPHRGARNAAPGELRTLPAGVMLMGKIRNDIDHFEVNRQ